MKTVLKKIPSEKVSRYSDEKFGINNRNDYVSALKKVVLYLNDPEIIRQIDNITPGKSPKESFEKLNNWLCKTYNDYSLYVDNPDVELQCDYKGNSGLIYLFPIDWLIELEKIDKKAFQIAVKIINTLSEKVDISNMNMDGRLFNSDYLYENDSEELTEYMKRLKLFDNYYYHILHEKRNIEHLNKSIKYLKRYSNSQIRDKLLTMASATLNIISTGGNLEEYTENYFNPLVDDESCIRLCEMFLFVWFDKNDNEINDYLENDIIETANTLSGEYGSMPFPNKIKLSPDMSLDKAIKTFQIQYDFFGEISFLREEFEEIKKLICHA